VHAVAFATARRSPAFIDAPPARVSRGPRYFSYSLTALARASLPSCRDARFDRHLSYWARSLHPELQRHGLARRVSSHVRFLAADLGPQGIRVNAISAAIQDPLGSRNSGRARCSPCGGHRAHPAQCDHPRTWVTRRALCSDLAAASAAKCCTSDGGYRTVGMSFPADGDGLETGVRPNYGQDAVSTETGI